TGSYDPTAGVLTLTGSDTVANYQAALRSVAYRNPADAPAAGDRIVTFVASDGQLSGAPAAVTVSLITVNDPPAANDNPTVAADAFTLVGGTRANRLPVLANDTAGPDHGESLAVAAVTQPAAGGSAAVAADGSAVLFTPAAGFNGTAAFTYTVSDGH